jgi:hypothetical protein
MTDNPYLKGKVPARYIGETPIVLAKFGGPYFDADGKPLKTLALRTGDTLYINEGEARGESWWHDPRREQESVRVGTGKVKMEKHKDVPEEELEQTGYEWHMGRGDFEEILPEGQIELPTQVVADSQVSTLSSILAPQVESVREAMPEEAGGA